MNLIQTFGLNRSAPFRRSRAEESTWPRFGVLAVWGVLAYNLLFAVFLLFHPVGQERIKQIDDLAGAEGPLLVGAAILSWFVRDRLRNPRKQRRGWTGWAPALIAIGVTCFGVGENIWSYYEIVLGQQTPFPSWADAAYLAAYPFLLAGILLLPRPSISLAGRARVGLDGLLVITAVATVMWYFVLGPTILQSYESVFSQYVGSAYPLFDLLLVASLLILARRTANPAMRPVVILGGIGLVSVVLVDIVFDYQTLHGSYADGGVIDVLWAFGYMLLGLAAGFAYRALRSHPGGTLAGDELAVQLQGQSTLFIAYLFVPVAVGLMVYAARTKGNAAVEPGLYIGGSALIALVLVRQFVVLLDNRKLAQQMQRQEERYRTILHTASDAIITVDDSNAILTVNPATEDIFGFSRNELEGSSLDVLFPASLRGTGAGSLRQLAFSRAEAEGGKHLETNGLHRDGREIPLELSFAMSQQGTARLFTCFARDISERVEARKELTHQALHDALTELPNRVLLQDRLTQALLAATREASPIALLLMDLDRFKEVNDTFGHDSGDLLLKEVAGRLTRTLRGADTVARLGGDEFAILLPGSDRAGAVGIAGKIENAVSESLEVEGRFLDVGCSIGIAVYPDHGADPAVLLRHADVAMYVAKRGGWGHSVYEPQRDAYSPTRLTLASDLRQAIATDALLLHFQPQVNLQTRRVDYVEALARWNHPERGLLSPAEFIPLAEETGAIADLTAWVLRSSIRERAAWLENGIELGIAVNVSTRVLRDAEFPAQVVAICREAGMDPAGLAVEVTESSIMSNPEDAENVLVQLHDLGVKISIDDFGTGYSSLGRLKRLPVQQVKIDKSFVLEMGQGDRDALAIVTSVIDLGHNLGLEVVAEGVETAKVVETLRAMRCDAIQGFYVAKPLSTSELQLWMAGISVREHQLFGAAPTA